MSNKVKAAFKSFHQVMSYELDAYGHVNNAVFLNYLEKARNDFLAQRGLRFQDFFKWEKLPVVTKAAVVFKCPAKAGDKLDITGEISNYSRISFTLSYSITNQDTHQLILSGETTHVFVDTNGKPLRIPAEFIEKFLEQ